ncbi:MAG: hypothetical protein WA428_01430 [Candidatus Cybelea sp.]
MRSLDFGRYALFCSVSAAMLAGCGGQQPPIGAPGAMAQTSALATQADRGKSWMLPDAKSFDLLYVSDDDELLVFSYPKGKLVGEINTPSGDLAGLCSDSAGDVFVPTAGSVSQSYIYEYAHGGTQPIATLTDPGEANGCAVDPKTGNLAVANASSVGGSKDYYGDVAIFPNGEGTPSTYFDSAISSYDYCAYDSGGNLYVSAHDGPPDIIGELPSGSGSFSNITLTEDIGPVSMQWVGSSLVVSSFANVQSKFGPQPIYEISVSGSTGVVSGPVLLHSPHDKNPYQPVQFWLQGDTMIGPDRVRGGNGLVNFWHYPAGGWPEKIIRRPGHAIGLYGVTMSKAK